MTDWSTRTQIREGADVYGSDDHKVGSVVAVQGNYIVVEKGFFFPTDYYIPTSAINAINDNRIYLNVTRDAALQSGWDLEPVDIESGTIATTTVEYDDELIAGAGMANARTAATERVSIQVHEEELVAERRPVDLGDVRVEKVVTSHEESLEVPLTEERLRVTRRQASGAADAGEDAFVEEVIEIPLRGEELEVGKRVRVSEEVDISREQVQRIERVSGTVRREDVRVEDRTRGGIIGATGDDTGIIEGGQIP